MDMPTAAAPRVTSVTIEFHRLGRAYTRPLTPDTSYIRTHGWNQPAEEVSPTFDHEQLMEYLVLLRYLGVGTGAERQAAHDALTAEAARFLPPMPALDQEIRQIDLVTNAAELWAFPFEAFLASQPDWLQAANAGVVLTRRIRDTLAAQMRPWPDRPKVLFAHAPITGDLDKALVCAHVKALRDSLTPWARGKVVGDALLTVREVGSIEELAAARQEVKAPYVHLLAHGAPVPGRITQREVWGLRLGYEGEPGIAPAAIADALAPVAAPLDPPPIVVTVMACDSANLTNPVFAVSSVVQELHRHGVDVVVGSQLPLTKPGSIVVTQSFYERLLSGQDVRAAIHAARVDVRAAAGTGHDWLGLVGYVRLPPEDYGKYLHAYGLRAELGMLDAAQAWAEEVSRDGDPRQEFDSLERALQVRLLSLEAKRAPLTDKALLDECDGLMSSTYKRLAHLLFDRGRVHQAKRADYWMSSRSALQQAAYHYTKVYARNLQNHWHGVQQLSLEAVLMGHLTRRDDWRAVRRAAEIARDAAPDAAGHKDIWSLGTLAEILLLAPIADERDADARRADRPRELDDAKAALAELKARATLAAQAFAIDSTRRQFKRYVNWWTTENGFFPGRDDLSAEAQELVEVLD